MGLLRTACRSPSQRVPPVTLMSLHNGGLPNAQAVRAVIHVVHLGRVPYADALKLQEDLVEYRKRGVIGDVLLLLEHPPVITLGRNSEERNLLLSRDELAQRGIDLFE